MSVGAVSDAVARYMVEQNPGIGDEHDVIIPVVGECDDSWLNDIAGRHVQRGARAARPSHAAKAGPVAEGSVGGGTGMVTCDFKARHRHLLAQAARGRSAATPWACW